MKSTAHPIARRLASLGTSSSFATRFTVTADPLLSVEGVGEIRLPVTLHTAHRLCAVAQPAQHGYKDLTLLDPDVRDTWEISAERLRFGSDQWATVLDDAVRRIAQKLGVPAPGSLRAELHNLLVYAPGQFFATHQDSEKADGMLGTLVITLPSSFTGGEFVVSHQGKKMRARGSENQLCMMAFYADCHHEVRPVNQGYRVVLTYNLIAQGTVATPEVPKQAVAELSAEVRRFWQTPAPLWPGDTDAEPPDRLVYLLDHQYTPSGLSWKRLKGMDVLCAAALQEVAKRLDAEIFLTLADVHETWSAEDNFQHYGYWGDEPEEKDDDWHDPELGELIDSDIELRHWLAPDDSRREDMSSVREGELCMNRLSVDCTPFQSEHEGYMGNYGNTVDRWYHRAAVVMWPRERAFVIRARQAPDWAISQVAERLDADDVIQGQAWARSLLPFWRGPAPGFDTDVLFAVTLRVAAGVDDAETAAGLLAPFPLAQVKLESVSWLLRLFEGYGIAWCVERFQQWANSRQSSVDQLTWIAEVLPELSCGLRGRVDSAILADSLVMQCRDWLYGHLAKMPPHAVESVRVSALITTSGAWLGLLRAQCPVVVEQVMDTLCSGQLPLQTSLEILHLAETLKDSSDLRLSLLHAQCVQDLEKNLASPERAANDWSIKLPDERGRQDDLTRLLRSFLASPRQQRLEWPLAEAKRRLVHQFIDSHELPVTHETRRVGRPYVLVLEKTNILFEREATERQWWRQELVWLQRTEARFI